MTQNKNIILKKLQVLTDTRALGLLAFGVVALLVTWSGIKVVQTNYELEKKISVARQQNAINQLENENLKLKNKYYESPQYLELTTRRQFGKAAVGEKLYTVPESVALSKTVESQATTQAVAEQASAKPKYQQNFDDWMKFLFSKTQG
ncbi:MAG: septum formation initiator family protein [Candidatus Saccharimonadales bacterium]